MPTKIKSCVGASHGHQRCNHKYLHPYRLLAKVTNDQPHFSAAKWDYDRVSAVDRAESAAIVQKDVAAPLNSLGVEHFYAMMRKLPVYKCTTREAVQALSCQILASSLDLATMTSHLHVTRLDVIEPRRRKRSRHNTL